MADTVLAPAGRARELPAWVWALAAVVLGGVGGVLGVALGDPARVVAGLVGLVIAALVLWRYEIGVVAILFTLPLDRYGRVLTHPMLVTLYQLALLLTLLSWAIALARRPGERLRFSAVDLGIGTLVFAALWSLPHSLSRPATSLAVVRLLFDWAFTLLFANALSKRRVARWATITLLATAVLSTLLALAQYFLPGFAFGNTLHVNQGDGLTITRVGALFYDPNYLAGFLSVAFVVAFTLLVHARRWRDAALHAAVAVVLSAGVLVTFSRTGLVGVAVAVLAVLLTAPARRRPWLLGALGALMVIGLLASPEAIVRRVESIGNPTSDLSVSTRYYMFGSAADIARDRPVWGTGIAAFEYAYPPYRRLDTLTFITKPHELPIALVAEMGVAGLIAELALTLAVISLFWRRRRRGWTPAEAFSLAALVSLILQALFQYYLYFEYLWFFVAFAVAANRLALEEESHVGNG